MGTEIEDLLVVGDSGFTIEDRKMMLHSQLKEMDAELKPLDDMIADATHVINPMVTDGAHKATSAVCSAMDAVDPLKIQFETRNRCGPNLLEHEAASSLKR